MATDIVFENYVNTAADIPTTLYPNLPSQSTPENVAFHSPKPMVNDTLADGTGVTLSWNYFHGEDVYARVAVGYQVQVLEGSFSYDQCQVVSPAPGPIIFESIANLKGETNPEDRYVNLRDSNMATTVAVTAGLLQPGKKYTARVRILVFSEKGDGVVDGQYFKYSQWGFVPVRVDAIPAAINLRVNGLPNPTALLASDGVTLSFTFSDTDGPSYLYRVEVGTAVGLSDVWDSGLMSGGAATAPRDFDIPYGGTALAAGTTYYWRVFVSDGMVDGGWTTEIVTFAINLDLQPASVLIGATPVSSTVVAPPHVAFSGQTLSWAADARQQAYRLILESGNDQVLDSGVVYSTGHAVLLSDLPENTLITVRLSLRDAVEMHPTYVGYFFANPQPAALYLLVDGEENPGDVANAQPAFSWQFSSDSPGNIQTQYRIQVADSDAYTSIVWDSGVVTSAAASVICGAVLVHGTYYWVRITVKDAFLFSDYTQAFFAINGAATAPTMTTPAWPTPFGPYLATINVAWTASNDPEGDPITYTLEMTESRSSNSNWRYLASLPSTSLAFSWDVSGLKAGTDYGVRVSANDGFVDSVPATSPVDLSGRGFIILPHAPSTPTFVLPATGTVASSVLRAEWLEADPPSVDGSQVRYVLEITGNSSDMTPTYDVVGAFNQGSSGALVDTSRLPNGADYRMRITAYDDKGATGAQVLSNVFSVSNIPVVKDFERLGANLYLGTSDGRILKATEAIWQLEEGFAADDNPQLKKFVEGKPTYSFGPDGLSIKAAPGETFLIQVGT